jgi:hypothetical protein
MFDDSDSSNSSNNDDDWNSDNINNAISQSLLEFQSSSTLQIPTITIDMITSCSPTVRQKSDGITMAFNAYEKIVRCQKEFYVVKITNGANGKSVYARVLESNDSKRDICMPKWMMDTLDASVGLSVIVTTDACATNFAKKIVFKIPKEMTNPISYLEYELTHHGIMYVGKIIKTMIFDKLICAQVVEIDCTNNTVPYCMINTCENKDVQFDITF